MPVFAIELISGQPMLFNNLNGGGGGGGSITWQEVTGTTHTLGSGEGIIANNAGLVTITLPSTAVLGDVYAIAGKGAGGWQLAQNAGQTVYFGNQSSTTGAGGSLASTHPRNCIYLVCVTANNDFQVISSIGNITVT